MKRWVVRVQTGQNEPFSPALPEIWVEQMRYAGMLSPQPAIAEAGEQVIDLNCPRGLDPKVWAEQTAGRMKSFGYNAKAMRK